jgi:hypothetical protein
MMLDKDRAGPGRVHRLLTTLKERTFLDPDDPDGPDDPDDPDDPGAVTKGEGHSLYPSRSRNSPQRADRSIVDGLRSQVKAGGGQS